MTEEKAKIELGKLIKKARKNKKWTQKNLGYAIGSNVETIRTYEDGTANPTFKMLFRISSVLGVKIFNFKKEKTK